MTNVIHFEIFVDDLERAVNFYSKVFGWKIEKAEGSEDYWSITTGSEEDPGISGGLRSQRMRPFWASRLDELDSTINTIEVPSVDGFAKRIAEAGGKVLRPKIAIAGMGYLQYCRDPDGNALAIMEFDESAQ